MTPVVARKVGHSIALSIPKQYAVDAGVEFLSYQTKMAVSSFHLKSLILLNLISRFKKMKIPSGSK